MAEAYAALMSLMHNLEVILHPSQQRLRINRIQIESLLQKVHSLQEFLEDYSHKDHKEMAALEHQIADMARAAESVIDYHVLDQIIARSTGNEAKSSTSFSEYIQSLIKEMEDLIETEVMRIKETIGASEEAWPLIDFSPAVSSRLAPEDQKTPVGSDKKLIEIMDTLTEQQPNRQIIAIVGMGGIEGFLKPVRDKSLEEVAIEYITNLSDRNLVFVRQHRILGGVETWGVHDLLKDLCQRNAEKENFLFGIDEHNRNIPPKKDFKSCLSFHIATEKFTSSGNQVLDLLRQASLTRSTTSVFASRALIWEVLEVVEEFSLVEEEIMQIPYFLRLYLLRSRKLNSMGNFIPLISRFWGLQSLIVSNRSSKLITLPSEIWDLPQLRHFISNDVGLRDPHSHNDEHNPHILENLQTLSGVVGFRCTNEVLKRAPNLKTLGVAYGRLPPRVQWHYFCLYNLVHLHELETLRFHSVGPISLNYLSFPLSLKELTLNGCHLPWEYTTIVGSLPNLEALWLENCAFEGQKWCPVEGEFLRLKVLAIAKTDLLHWKADKTHFPILEHLLLGSLNLEEFPEDFGELPTLRQIEVLSCSDSTNAWTAQIREEQESFGNEDLQLIVNEREVV